MAVLFFSCQKELSPNLPTTDTSLQNSKADFYVEDGYLHLKNWAVADTLMSVISKMSENEVLSWEKSIGFESARSLENKLFAEYEKIETLEQMKNFKSKYSSVLMFSNEPDNFGFELVGHTKMYDPITSSKGLFQVGNIQYLKSPSGLKIFYIQEKEKTEIKIDLLSKSAGSLKYITISDPLENDVENIDSSVNFYNNDNSPTRLFNCYLEIYPQLKEVASDPIAGTVYDVFFNYKLRLRGQKKGTFGWSTYKANFALKDPKFRLESDSYNIQKLGTNSSSDQNNVYLQLGWWYVGRYNTNAYSPMITVQIPDISFNTTVWSSGVSTQKTYEFVGCGMSWTTLPWQNFSFSY